MQIQGLSVLGGLHQLLGAAPILVLCVLSQQLFLQRLDSLGVSLAVQVGSLLHCCERRPALGIYDVRILEGVRHVVGYTEGTSGFLRVLSCHFLYLGHDLIALGMSQHNFHSHTGHQAYHTLRYGQGLAVRRRVSPGHGQLLALQILHSAELMDDVEHIGHTLGGMVDVAL